MSTMGSGTATGNWNSGSSTSGSTNDFAFRNYGSRLPEVYTGHPNRVERYNQYEMMDVDPEINACLDILSEFSTQQNEHNKTPFDITFNEDPTQIEVELISKQLKQWCKLNEFDTRIFKIFRNTMKYGDQIFVRDPETFKLYWIDMTKVVKVIVNESEGKASVRVRGTIRANFGEPLRHAALLGHGISMHPTYMVMQDIQAGRLVSVMPEFKPIGVDIYAVFPSRKNLPLRVRTFLDFLRQWFSAADWHAFQNVP
mgnify:CR=1 FL=1